MEWVIVDATVCWQRRGGFRVCIAANKKKSKKQVIAVIVRGVQPVSWNAGISTKDWVDSLPDDKDVGRSAAHS